MLMAQPKIVQYLVSRLPFRGRIPRLLNGVLATGAKPAKVGVIGVRLTVLAGYST